MGTKNRKGLIYYFFKGGFDMGDKGKKDKSKREHQKKAKLTQKEKRKKKKEKNINQRPADPY